MADDVGKKVAWLIVVGDSWVRDVLRGFKLVAVLQEACCEIPSRHEPVPGSKGCYASYRVRGRTTHPEESGVQRFGSI
jgi:hypothetical protein